jgi:hypothetical protein
LGIGRGGQNHNDRQRHGDEDTLSFTSAVARTLIGHLSRVRCHRRLKSQIIVTHDVHGMAIEPAKAVIPGGRLWHMESAACRLRQIQISRFSRNDQSPRLSQ